MATNFLMFVWIKSSIMCEITKKCMSNSKQGKLFGESHSVFLIMKCVAVTIDYKLESMRYKWKKKKRKMIMIYCMKRTKHHFMFSIFFLLECRWCIRMWHMLKYVSYFRSSFTEVLCYFFSFFVEKKAESRKIATKQSISWHFFFHTGT